MSHTVSPQDAHSLVCKPSKGQSRVSFVEREIDSDYNPNEPPMWGAVLDDGQQGEGDGSDDPKKNHVLEGDRRVSTDQVVADAEVDRIFDEVFVVDIDRQKSSLKSSMRTVHMEQFNDEDDDDDSFSDEDVAAIRKLKRFMFSRGGERIFLISMVGLMIIFVYFIIQITITEKKPMPPIEYMLNHSSVRPTSSPVRSPVTMPPTVAALERPVDSSSIAPVVPPDTSPWELALGPQASSSTYQSPEVEMTEMIGFIAAPMDTEELQLLLATNPEFQAAPNSLDLSEHEEFTTDAGDTFHCGIKVDGMAILVKCEANDELCRVYLTATSDDSCESEMS